MWSLGASWSPRTVLVTPGLYPPGRALCDITKGTSRLVSALMSDFQGCFFSTHFQKGGAFLFTDRQDRSLIENQVRHILLNMGPLK